MTSRLGNAGSPLARTAAGSAEAAQAGEMARSPRTRATSGDGVLRRAGEKNRDEDVMSAEWLNDRDLPP